MQQNLFGKQVGGKRPIPPKGYIRYKERGQYAHTSVCPNCKLVGGGTAYGGGGWQDEQIQKKYEENKDSHSSYDVLCLTDEDGVMMKSQWSRYCEGEFLCCGAKLWHDFGGEEDREWHYYYLPKRFTEEEKQAYLKKEAEWKKKHDEEIKEMIERHNENEEEENIEDEFLEGE